VKDSTTLRPRWGIVLTAVVAALSALGLVTLLVTGDPGQILRYSWGLLLIPYLTWLAFWSPAVTVAPHGVTVRNLVREHTVTWPAIQRVETKYAMTLYTTAGKITAWSAPTPGRYAATRASRADLAGLPESTYGAGSSIGAGDIPSSESGLVAFHVRREWERLRDAGHLDSGRVEGTGVQTHWLWGRAAIAAVLVLGTALGLLL
jgi:hypothetical protein